ncbi:MAG: hypothetical protein ACXVB9_00135 [Bdellovibrionota bacterium]
MKIRFRFRALLYSVSLALLATGVIWELLDRFVTVSTAIGEMKHPAQPWVLRLHGAAALISVFVFGQLYSSHIRPSWRSRRKRWTGSILVGVITVLILSGYLLYYSSGDEFRSLVSFSHLWLGIAAPAPFLFHLFRKSPR